MGGMNKAKLNYTAAVVEVVPLAAPAIYRKISFLHCLASPG
jgi:hypothetical protein